MLVFCKSVSKWKILVKLAKSHDVVHFSGRAVAPQPICTSLPCVHGETVANEFSIGGALHLFRGAWHSGTWQKLHRLLVLHNSIWGLGALFGGDEPLKAPRGDGTGARPHEFLSKAAGYAPLLQLGSACSIELLILNMFPEARVWKRLSWDTSSANLCVAIRKPQSSPRQPFFLFGFDFHDCGRNSDWPHVWPHQDSSAR